MAPTAITSNEKLCLLLNAFLKAFGNSKGKHDNFISYLEYSLKRHSKSTGITARPAIEDKKRRKPKNNYKKATKKAKLEN